MMLSTDQRRALRLLDGTEPHGCTENVMAAHGFKTELLAGLVRDGLANVAAKTMLAGRQPMKVVRLRITEAGAAGALAALIVIRYRHDASPSPRRSMRRPRRDRCF
jgi:hypothetical protein